jgi:hypothetical protein
VDFYKSPEKEMSGANGNGWSLPEWLQTAIELLKRAAGVDAITGRYVETFRRQLAAFGQSDLMVDLDNRCREQLQASIAFNESLAKRGKHRQSLRTLIEEGRWRDAPSAHSRTHAREQAQAQREEQERQEFWRYMQPGIYLDGRGIERESYPTWCERIDRERHGCIDDGDYLGVQIARQERWERALAEHRKAITALVEKAMV